MKKLIHAFVPSALKRVVREKREKEVDSALGSATTESRAAADNDSSSRVASRLIAKWDCPRR